MLSTDRQTVAGESFLDADSASTGERGMGALDNAESHPIPQCESARLLASLPLNPDSEDPLCRRARSAPFMEEGLGALA